AAVPFICAFILFFSKETPKRILKPLAAVIIYNIVPVITQTVKMFVSWINSDNSDTPQVFGAEFISDTVLFLLILGIYVIYAGKSNRQLQFDKIDLPLYILIVLALSVFIASLAFIDRYIKDTQVNNTYFILLLNVPTIAAAIAYASRKMVKSKLSADAYKTILEENIRHYETLEEKNEELRLFRHDFPKTIAPVLMCIKDGNAEEAEKILNEFNVAVQSTKPKYITGNHRLDNVLEVQSQKSQKVGVEIELTPGSSFPPHGIDPIDIYTIFPNALDNAAEACVKSGGTKITVKSKTVGSAVYVKISNPYKEGEIKKSGDGFITTKSDKSRHGFGTKSIKKAVSKYGSENIFFEAENGIFTLSFSLDFNYNPEA
ncbi:MAG: ATP-binding protein, partial [Clostridia bacterium]|nr:ATP-binding protein [Clostridia bacterium]